MTLRRTLIFSWLYSRFSSTFCSSPCRTPGAPLHFGILSVGGGWVSLESVSISVLGSDGGGGGVCCLGSAPEPIRSSGGAGLHLTCIGFKAFLGGGVGVAWDSQPVGFDVADLFVCVVAHLSFACCDACCAVDSVLTRVCVCCALCVVKSLLGFSNCVDASVFASFLLDCEGVEHAFCVVWLGICAYVGCPTVEFCFCKRGEQLFLGGVGSVILAWTWLAARFRQAGAMQGGACDCLRPQLVHNLGDDVITWHGRGVTGLGTSPFSDWPRLHSCVIVWLCRLASSDSAPSLQTPPTTSGAIILPLTYRGVLFKLPLCPDWFGLDLIWQYTSLSCDVLSCATWFLDAALTTCLPLTSQHLTRSSDMVSVVGPLAVLTVGVLFFNDGSERRPGEVWTPTLHKGPHFWDRTARPPARGTSSAGTALDASAARRPMTSADWLSPQRRSWRGCGLRL